MLSQLRAVFRNMGKSHSSSKCVTVAVAAAVKVTVVVAVALVKTQHITIFPCGAGQPLVANNSSNSSSVDSVRPKKQESLANFFLGVKIVCLFIEW